MENPRFTGDCWAALPDGDCVATTDARQRRIVLYSHDTMGLGHVRRNLLIAQALVSSDQSVTILLISGARETGRFSIPDRVDCLSLPSLYKDADGRYRSRRLGVHIHDLIAVRSSAIRAAIDAFDPDAFFVDNVPRGALRELDPTLELLRARGRTRCILGLRDVLDEPATVACEWLHAANEEAIRNYYDTIWIYGDPAAYDPVREYGFSDEVAAKVRFTGYLDQSMRLKPGQVEDCKPRLDLGLPPGRLALCLVGGGQDGALLAEAFIHAPLPEDVNAVIVTGPYMPPESQEQLRRATANQPRLRVLEFVSEPALLMAQADYVVAMGGYNTVCEVLSFDKPALIVPRSRPRREQLIRAERLRDLGLIDMLPPEQLSPTAIGRWLADSTGPKMHARDRIDLNGLIRLPYLLAELLQRPPALPRSLTIRSDVHHVV